jgi:hypothetical protein
MSSSARKEKKQMTHKQWSLIGVLGFIPLLLILTATRLSIVPAVVFTIPLVGGLALWLATTYKLQVDPLKLITPYLLTLIFFIIHVYEEYITDFEVAMTDISGFHVLERDFLTIVAFLGPVVWLSGAILLLKRIDAGYYFMSSMYVGMIFGELAHFVFPFMEDGTFHYVSGMYTALLPLFPASYGLLVTLREVRNANALSAANLRRSVHSS